MKFKIYKYMIMEGKMVYYYRDIYNLFECKQRGGNMWGGGYGMGLRGRLYGIVLYSLRIGKGLNSESLNIV